jgi:cyclic beta-1,2-glucan synthetase
VPQYVSTVDSGNLAGHLIAVKQAAIELPEERLFDARLLHGLADGFTLLREEARQLSTMKERSQVVTFKQLNKEIEAWLRVVETMNGESTDLSEWSKLFEDMSSS